VRKIQIELVS